MEEVKEGYFPLLNVNAPHYALPPALPQAGSVSIAIGPLPRSSSSAAVAALASTRQVESGVAERESSSSRVRLIRECCQKMPAIVTPCSRAFGFCCGLSCSGLLKVTTNLTFFCGAIIGALVGLGFGAIAGLTYGCYSAYKKSDCCEVFQVAEDVIKKTSDVGSTLSAFLPFQLWLRCQDLAEGSIEGVCDDCRTCANECLDVTSVVPIVQNGVCNSNSSSNQNFLRALSN